MGSIFLKVFVGAVAGLLCWAIFEPFAPKVLTEQAWGNWELMFTLGLGSIAGLAIGGVSGLIQGGKIHTARGALLGLLFGAIGCCLGYGVGGTLAKASHLPIQSVPWRILALTPIGTFLGLAIGASTLNIPRTVQGLIGGTLGGLVGGALFDTISGILAPVQLAVRGIQAGTSGEVGGPARAVYAVLMLASIALFIGLVERFARSAWVRLTLGRNEGKEWVVDASQNFLGRSERAQIPLFGDPNIAEMHACIVRQGPGQFLLADGGSPMGTFLNGQRIQQAQLFHGAIITIGSYNLEFLLKNQRAPVRGPEAYPGQAYPISGQTQTAPVQPTQNPPYGTLGAGQMQAPLNQTQVATPYVAPTPTAYTLTALDGPLTGQRFTVSASTEVGRELPSIPLSFDSQVSRRHVILMPEAMGLAVTDLNSTNGTFVNGQRVQSQTVRQGDLVKIGATTFRVD